MSAYLIEKQNDGSIVVRGKRLEQFTKMTDFSSEGGIRRFRDVIDRIGLKNALNRERQDNDSQVLIGDTSIEQYL